MSENANQANVGLHLNPLQLVGLLAELNSLYQELKSDGTLDKLVAAEEAVMAELHSNAKLQSLLHKLQALQPKV
jgi:hypothetical protein